MHPRHSIDLLRNISFPNKGMTRGKDKDKNRSSLAPEQVLEMARSAEKTHGTYLLSALLWIPNPLSLPSTLRSEIESDLLRLWNESDANLWGEVATMMAWLGGAAGQAFLPQLLGRIDLFSSSLTEHPHLRSLRPSLYPHLVRPLLTLGEEAESVVPSVEMACRLWLSAAMEGDAREVWARDIWNDLFGLMKKSGSSEARRIFLKTMRSAPGDALNITEYLRLSSLPWIYEDPALTDSICDAVSEGFIAASTVLPHLPAAQIRLLVQKWLSPARPGSAQSILSVLDYLAEHTEKREALDKDIVRQLLSHSTPAVRLAAIRLSALF